MTTIDNMNWYAIRVQNNKERKVLDSIKSELDWSGLTNLVGDILIPSEKVVEIKKSKKKETEKMLYPGYIFIQTSSTGELNNLMRGINGCAGFVRTRSGEVLPMKNREIEDILSSMEINKLKSFEDIFAKGEEIEITDGPFKGFKGKIDEIDEEKNKIKVFVMIFGRPTPVELTNSQIKKIL